MARQRIAVALLSTTLLAEAQPRPTVIIGGEDSQGAALGRVKDVAVIGRVLVVLEDDAPHVRVFSHDGRLRQTLGRTGAGPGEYRAPFTLAVDPAKAQVLIVDPANARLTQYAVSDTLALSATIPVDVPMTRAVCPRATDLLALAGVDSIPVRALDLRGGRLAESAGIGRKASHHALAAHPMLRSYIAAGPVLCATNEDQIIVGSPLLGEVLVLRPSRPRETVLIPLPGFRPLAFAAAGGGLQLSMRVQGFYERLVGLRMRGGSVEATIARLEVEAPRSEVIRSYRVVEIQDRNARVVSGARSWHEVGRTASQVICYRQDPVPTLTYWTQPACP